ncbi:MAG: hypothetical protein R3C32_11920 [Chloroflexota bacterium]
MSRRQRNGPLAGGPAPIAAEAVARTHLEGLGWTMSSRPTSWRHGELDLVALDPDTPGAWSSSRCAAHGRLASVRPRSRSTHASWPASRVGRELLGSGWATRSP